MKKIRILILAAVVMGLFQGNLFSIIYSRIEGVVIDESGGPSKWGKSDAVQLCRHGSSYILL